MNAVEKRPIVASAAVLLFAITAPQPAAAIYGIAVGDGGTIRQTPDGGNWFPRSSGTTQSLRSVSCVGRYCWIVGDQGTILRSVDAGVTWQPQSSGTTHTLSGVDFVTPNHGWAVGDMGTILVTSNGGTTWSNQDATLSTDLFDVDFVDVNTGWIGGASGTIRYTNDGGLNWGFQSSGVFSGGVGIDFTSATDGWYGASQGVGLVGKTSTGGSDWSTMNPDPDLQNFDYRAVDFVSAVQGIVTGRNGWAYFTDDAGMNWSKVGLTGAFNGVSISNQGIGWIVGDTGALRKTIDGGRSWSIQMSGTPQILWGVVAFDVFPDGDYNRDHMVDEADYQAWQSAFGSTSNLAADGNGDGSVDAADFVMWRKVEGIGNGESTAFPLSSIPEPVSSLLLVLGITLEIAKRTRLRFDPHSNTG